MRLEKLLADPPPPSAGPSAGKVAIAGGEIEIRYEPPWEGEEPLSEQQFLNRHLTGWDVTDADGLPVPLNADVIARLDPEARRAICVAIRDEEHKPEEGHPPGGRSRHK